MDIISEHIIKILNNFKTSTIQSIQEQTQNIQSASNFKKLSLKSNGGSFISINNNRQKDNNSILKAHVDGCLSNDFIEIGTTCKSTKPFPIIMPYLYLLKTLFIGYTDNIDNHIAIKDAIYPLIPSEILNNKESQLAMIISIGKPNNTMYQIGIKKNQGIIFSVNHIDESNVIKMQYDDGHMIYINHSGLYATFNDNYKIGINISNFIANLKHNNLKLYNIIAGYGSNGLFIMLFLEIFIELLGLYLLLEILYEDEMKISVRLHQACTEIETFNLENTMSYNI